MVPCILTYLRGLYPIIALWKSKKEMYPQCPAEEWKDLWNGIEKERMLITGNGVRWSSASVSGITAAMSLGAKPLMGGYPPPSVDSTNLETGFDPQLIELVNVAFTNTGIGPGTNPLLIPSSGYVT